MSADIVSIQDIASGSITGAGVVQRQRGCVLARTGVGVYTATINPNNLGGPELDFSESCCKVNTVGVGGGVLNADLTHTSDTVKTITLRNTAGALADSEFSIRLSRILG